jgi:metal-responsive CopG/Arc/MetJ family transcriptional regulator
MPPKGFVSISFPLEMYEKLKQLIDNPIIKSKHGYRSIPEVVRDALSDKIKELEAEIEKEEVFKS